MRPRRGARRFWCGARARGHRVGFFTSELGVLAAADAVKVVVEVEVV